MKRPFLLAALLSLATLPVQAFDLQVHRGARGLLPENTLPAFQRAIDLGGDTIECDMAITKDGVVVIHHDLWLNPDIARGPDGQWLERRGPAISELTFEELQKYDVGRLKPGTKYAAEFPEQQPVDGTRIPRLSDLFRPGEEVRQREDRLRLRDEGGSGRARGHAPAGGISSAA